MNNKIKNILWDFDGVIFDGMKIKANGFKELFNSAKKEQIDRFLEFHYTHGGVPRFQKIEYFYKEILGKDISFDEVNVLAKRFARIIERKLYSRDNLIKDSIGFIKKNYKKYSFHITSGAEHNELNRVCEYFNLSQYFITIEGSPPTKDILIRDILEKYNYKKEETILIGDSITDYSASLKNGIGFYGYNNIELKKFNYIESFNEFKI